MEISEIQIESGIDIDGIEPNQERQKWCDLISRMEIGQSILIPDQMSYSVAVGVFRSLGFGCEIRGASAGSRLWRSY